MRKKTISRSIALAAGALLSTAVMAKPPNILVIMSDDVGWGECLQSWHDGL